MMTPAITHEYHRLTNFGLWGGTQAVNQGKNSQNTIRNTRSK